MDFKEFDIEIETFLKEIKLVLDNKQKEELYKFMNLLIEKNKEINLTAITEQKEIILKHFIDSIIIEKYIENKESIIDVGTGAGFPGIPLKIVKKQNKLLLLDSLNKRINFLEEIIEELKLENISAKHIRAEEAGQNKKYREKFDIAISRAVSKLNILVEYMLPLIKIKGKCICMKGPNIESELKEAENAIKLLGGKLIKKEEYNLPNSDIKRTIIIIEKIKETPTKYPRKAGVPNSKPIQ